MFTCSHQLQVKNKYQVPKPWPKRDEKELKKAVDEVLAASRSLTEEQKVRHRCVP